jgi:protein phosphatase
MWLFFVLIMMILFNIEHNILTTHRPTEKRIETGENMIKTNQIQYSAISDTGTVRENNEDNLYIDGQYMQQGKQGNFQVTKKIDSNNLIYAVCDGMGGEKGGEKASLEAVTRLRLAVENPPFVGKSLEEKIKEVNGYVSETNTAIYSLATGAFENKGMGTTFACLIIANNRAAAMNVGDSRVYLFRERKLTQLTRDHSESERLIRLGIITHEQARGHRSRFILNRHLGMPPEEGILEAESKGIVNLQRGDQFLLCSDGLTDMVDDEVIKNILSVSADTKLATQSLINEALKNGGKDNVTAIVVKLEKLSGRGYVKNSQVGAVHNIYPQRLIFLIALCVVIVIIIVFALLLNWPTNRKNKSTDKVSNDTTETTEVSTTQTTVESTTKTTDDTSNETNNSSSDQIDPTITSRPTHSSNDSIGGGAGATPTEETIPVPS